MTNREDIIRMAREADLIDDSYASDWYIYQLERFAALVAAEEREACAKVCEEAEVVQKTYYTTLHDEGAETLRKAAAAIRARSNNDD